MTDDDALIARLRKDADAWDDYNATVAGPNTAMLERNAADRLAAQAQRIAELDDASRRLHDAWGQEIKRAEKAEAALAAALECVKAADAWAYGGEPDTVLEGRYDNIRAKHREVIDAALAAQEKPS